MSRQLYSEDSKRFFVLNHIPFSEGSGFNEIWRELKSDGISLSYSTLSTVLKDLVEERCLESKSIKGGGIPKKLYIKTVRGSEYELHLNGKMKVTEAPTKRIIKAKSEPAKYGQVIFDRFPFTFEVELSAEQVNEKVEGPLTKFVGEMGETMVHNMAEILNNAYTNFLSDLADGKSAEALRSLKKGLEFGFKLTYTFNGDKVKIDRVWSRLDEGEKELLQARRTIAVPSYMEILGAWLLSFLKPLNPQLMERFNLSNLEGWAELITDHGNRWRKMKGLPLLKKKRVEVYLERLVSTGRLSIKPFKFDGATLDFDGMPEPTPQEFYSFLAGLFSNIRVFLES